MNKDLLQIARAAGNSSLRGQSNDHRVSGANDCVGSASCTVLLQALTLGDATVLHASPRMDVSTLVVDHFSVLSDLPRPFIPSLFLINHTKKPRLRCDAYFLAVTTMPV